MAPNLTFVPINNVNSVNFFQYLTNWKVTQGNVYTLLLQLQDINQQIGATQAFTTEPQTPLYLRYMPSAGSALTLTFNNLDASAVVTTIASQPYANDTSVWSFNLSASQTALMSGGNVYASFFEGNTSTTFNFIVPNAMTVLPLNKSSC